MFKPIFLVDAAFWQSVKEPFLLLTVLLILLLAATAVCMYRIIRREKKRSAEAQTAEHTLSEDAPC